MQEVLNKQIAALTNEVNNMKKHDSGQERSASPGSQHGRGGSRDRKRESRADPDFPGCAHCRELGHFRSKCGKYHDLQEAAGIKRGSHLKPPGYEGAWEKYKAKKAAAAGNPNHLKSMIADGHDTDDDDSIADGMSDVEQQPTVTKPLRQLALRPPFSPATAAR